ncbi:hypothetical protein ES704_02511 [subsurface metagenome]
MHRFIFKMGYFLKRPEVIRYYKNFQRTQWDPFESLKKHQNKQLQKLVEFTHANVPYYMKLFNRLGIKPNDITTVKDLEKLPILTKQTIKENWQDFIPQNTNKVKYLNGSTGGSTGIPLKYRMSVCDYERGVGLLYRGWGYGGYKLGDKIAVIAGSSLIPNLRSESRRKIQDLFLNCRHYSSFKMSEKKLFKYFYNINNWKPYFIRGYASSIYLFAKFIQENNLKLEFQLKAIFSTAEKLFDKQRELIEQVLGVKVFDNYGLNDGGISAYECERHIGMHIDMERAILETVSDENKQVFNQEGRILATSLYNYALPFIRYDTGDLGILSDLECACGRKTPLLKEIVGRVSEFITTVSGLKIHGEFFSHIFYEIDNISQFQVIQDKMDEILIKIVPDNLQTKEDIDVIKIKDIIRKKDADLKVRIQFISEGEIEQTKAGKYKFIINNLNQAIL